MCAEVSRGEKYPCIDNIHNIYMFVRHGQTDLNAHRVLPGSLDVPLNAIGVCQAQQVVLPLRPTAVFCSDLVRANHTATIIAQVHNLESSITTDSRLREKNQGSAEGMLIADIIKVYPDIWNAWSIEDEYTIAASSVYPGGESDLDVAQRVNGLIEDLENTLVNQILLLVTHGGVIRATRLLFGLSKELVYPGREITNCSIEIYKPNSPQGIIYE